MKVINKTSKLKVNLPKRGYALRTFNEKLIVIKNRTADYEQLSRSLLNAFSPDKHLLVEMIRVAA